MSGAGLAEQLGERTPQRPFGQRRVVLPARRAVDREVPALRRRIVDTSPPPRRRLSRAVARAVLLGLTLALSAGAVPAVTFALHRAGVF